MLKTVNAITLRDFQEKDIINKIKWINDTDNNRYLHYDLPLEYEKTLQWYQNKNNVTRLDLIIEYCHVPVGVIGLIGIDRIHNKAEFYICLGEKQYKRKGIASVATKMLIDYAFTELSLRKIYLNVDAENSTACYLYEKIGFVCEGYFKKDILHRGEYIDRKRYAILEEEWKN